MTVAVDCVSRVKRTFFASMRVVAALLPCLLCAAPTHALPQSFTTGDLYLVSNVLPAGNGQSIGAGAVRINPQTGATLRLPFTLSSLQGRATYDPARNRIIAMTHSGTLEMIDAAGVVQALQMNPQPFVRAVAPTGCGRLYVLHSNLVSVVQPDGNVLPVMNQAGTQALTLTIAAGGVVMIFDATHNCLLLADPHGAGLMRVQRLPLSSDGLRAAGTITSNAADIIPGQSEIPMTFSAGPGGQAFLKIQDSSNATAPRMVLVHPQTLAFTTYASSGYTGVTGEVTGCFSSVRNQGVTLDTVNDVLRAFDLNHSGAGTIFSSSNLSGSGSGETAMLLEIGGTVNNPIVCPPPPCAADINGDGAVNVTDLLAVISNWGATGANPADINTDGVVNVSDLLAVISAWGTCP